jgi:hypothetical protein
MTQLEKAKAFLIPKARQILQFLMKQGIAVTGNLVYGLLCVRLLPISDYAKFAVLFGYMGSLTVLLDMGVAGTLAPLVGEQIANLQLIANYVASLRRIALKLYLVVAPIAILAFVLLVQKRHWGFWVVTQMVAALLVTAWFARVSASYGAVLIIRRDRARYYRVQIIGSLGSLTLLLIFWALHWMNIYVGILLNVAQIVYIATSYYRRSRHLLRVKGEPSQQKQKAIVRLATPNVPGAVFYAIQGQVTLMLITVFGHSVTSVANIGALSRLGQILVFFSQMNPILVEPFFARLPAARLKRTYLLAVTLIAVCASGFAALAFLFPEIFLWILGPNYRQLHFEVGLVILASVIQYTGGFIWVVNSSRRFVYWWNNFMIIALTLLVQGAFIWKFDLSSIRNVLTLNIASTSVSLLMAVACAVYGFVRGPQKLDASHSDETPQSLERELHT